MHVLEIEQEFETLVGSKKIGPPAAAKRQLHGSSVGVGKGVVAKTVLQRNFMTNVVVVAGAVLLLLLYLSGKDSSGTGPTDNSFGGSNKGAQSQTAPVTSHVTVGGSTPTEVIAVVPSNADTSDASLTSPPVDSPNAPPVAPESEERNDPLPINVYSKFATLPPLPLTQSYDNATREKLTEKYGQWHFWDDDEEDRPTEDYLSKYPNRDVPSDAFPDHAWQADAVFVNHFLSDAGKLVDRAMEAIYAEYGHPGDGMTPQDLDNRAHSIFYWKVLDEGSAGNGFLMNEAGTPKEEMEKISKAAGLLPKRTYDGLIRRLLHAMMTSDTFTVVVAGHSVVAGSGNKFQQNYAMQFHRIMAPILARLGVKLVTRNMGNGGLGTLQSSLGMSWIMGDELDLLFWDSKMTEGPDDQDVFLRQALIGGKRVPVILGNEPHEAEWSKYYDLCDAEIGKYKTHTEGLPVTTSAEQALKLPWATQFLECNADSKNVCRYAERFCKHCWIDPTGDGNIHPPVEQRSELDEPGNWHPGWREQQLRGRILAMGVLKVLRDAIDIWNENVQGGPPLDDSLWHISDHYENIREKFKKTSLEVGGCVNTYGGKMFPARLCNLPMKGITAHTPRAYPKSSLTAHIKPAPDGTKPENPYKLFYDGPMPMEPCMEVPEGEIDVYAIVTGRRMLGGMIEEPLRRLLPIKSNQASISFSTTQSSVGENKASTKSLRGVNYLGDASTTTGRHGNQTTLPETKNYSRALEEIVPGKGWEVFDEYVGTCNGQYDSRCEEGPESKCLMLGYNSNRGLITGNELSGWLVLTLPEVKAGLIILKIDTWQKYSNSNHVTEGWATVNNETRRLKGYDIQNLPDTFAFDFAIDGKVTTLTKDVFLESNKRITRTISLLTVLDDANLTLEAKNMEVAIRMRGCERKCTFGLSHVYWS